MFRVTVMLQTPHSLRLISQTGADIFRYNSELFAPSIMASPSGQDSAKQALTILPPPCFTNGIRGIKMECIIEFFFSESFYFGLIHP